MKKTMQPTLYLIPVPLSDAPAEQVLPAAVKDIINRINHFIVEDIRTARRHLRKMGFTGSIDSLTFYLLNEHTRPEEYRALMSPLKEGHSVGLMSDAGIPVVADPGNGYILLVQQAGFRVVPLTGPSSIFLALMASGLNGQNFTFHGYLPVQQGARIKKIKELEKISAACGQSQLFMEAPYRNAALLRDILNNCKPETYLCIAADITSENEFICTRTVAVWKEKMPDIQKHPAIFILSGYRQAVT
jgi:16S rRNA (cytidine1402-2'-O)-methyltransferase